MRKAAALLTICLCVLLLTGCYSTRTPQKETEPLSITQIYDTGLFQVPVPAPWQVFPIEDPFAEGRPVKTDCVFLRKGGQSDSQVFEKPYIRVEYFPPDVQLETWEINDDITKNVEQLEPMQLGDAVWNGYVADEYQGRACVGRFANLWTESQTHKFRVVINLQCGGETIRLEDRDVQCILAGLAP